MHDYSRDIMLANAQQDMEAGLQKMQLNKKVALTKSNEEKAASLKKQNDELGYMFLPTQVSIEILQGKDPKEMSQKVERAALLMVEIHGVADFCALVSHKGSYIKLEVLCYGPSFSNVSLCSRSVSHTFPTGYLVKL